MSDTSPLATPSTSTRDPVSLFAEPTKNVHQLDQSKLPIFFGESGRDACTPLEFINRVDAAMIANEWSDEQTYAYVSGCLFGEAAQWIRHSKVDKENPQDTWTWLKPQFRKRFFHKVNQTAIADALKTIKPREDAMTFNPHHAFTELMDAFDIIEEYLPLPAGLPNAANTHYTIADVKNAYMSVRTDMLNQFRRNLFLNMMPPLFRNKVMDKNKEKITEMLEEAVKIRDARDLCINAKKMTIAEAAPEPQGQENEDEEIDAIRFTNIRRGQPNFRPQQPNLRTQQPQSRPQQRPGQSNASRSGYQDKSQFKCVYCQKMGHNAEECRKRLADKAPCYSNRGIAYYPERKQNRSQNFKRTQNTQQGLYNIENEDFLMRV